MRTWRIIGGLWMLLTWLLVGGPSAYAGTTATVRSAYPSEIGRREKPTPPQEETITARTGTPCIARLPRERASGNGDITPPLALLPISFFTTHRLGSEPARLRFPWLVSGPRKAEGGSPGSRAPPALR